MKIYLPQNLQEVEMKSFEPVPPGTYTVEVKKVEEKQGKEYPYLNVRFDIIEDDDYAGRVIFEMFSLAPSALFKLKGLCDALNLEVTDEIDPEDMIGETCEAVVTIERGGLKNPSDPDSESYPDKNRIKECK
jgi:hypothetical protein